jgi:hypothetical protein
LPLPGIAGLVGGTLVQYIPALLSRPKWTIIGGIFIAIAPATVLLILGDGGHGNDYWKYMVSPVKTVKMLKIFVNMLTVCEDFGRQFTGCAIGSFGMM